QRGEARGTTVRAADAVSVRPQPENRQVARSRTSTDAACTRRRGDRMRRREFIALLGGAAGSGPRIAFAEQSTRLRRIAFLGNEIPLSPACVSNQPDVALPAFLEALHLLGYEDGQNVALECRSAEGKYERLDALAAELVQLNPAV